MWGKGVPPQKDRFGEGEEKVCPSGSGGAQPGPSKELHFHFVFTLATAVSMIALLKVIAL